jgi:hypothetical protein
MIGCSTLSGKVRKRSNGIGRRPVDAPDRGSIIMFKKWGRERGWPFIKGAILPPFYRPISAFYEIGFFMSYFNSFRPSIRVIERRRRFF